jgi:hypothetical protein
MKRTAVLFLIAVVLFVLLVSGCSPSPSPTPTSTSSPTATLPPGQEPVEVISIVGPLPDSYEDGKPVYNPGGPIVEITLKNVSDEPVIFLEVTLQAESAFGKPFLFSFDEISSHNPLLPGENISSRQTLIGGGFADNISYPLTIKGTLQSNVAFFYTKEVLITSPTE